MRRMPRQVLIIVILDFLHARFVMFPFNAVGFVISMSRLNIKMGFWAPFLVAWVLKAITLRVGCSKLYEKVGVSFSQSRIGLSGIAVNLIVIAVPGLCLLSRVRLIDFL